jgi:hypothetical protein
VAMGQKSLEPQKRMVTNIQKTSMNKY